MRIEAGIHPAALYITAVYLNNEKLAGLVKLVDLDTGEIGRYKADALGNPVVADDEFVLEVLRGAVRIEIADEHKRWLEWQP